ncbi:unnamed protein product [Rhodiola kirilowii]
MRIMSGQFACRKMNRSGGYHMLELARSMVTRCRAVILPRFGGPDVLEIRDDVEVPDLKADEVLVRSRAVSVNPLDTRMRAGYGRSIFEPLLPLILGRDVSGEVAAVGASVRSLRVGQEVFGALHPTAARGTYTEYAILPESELTKKPEQMSHVFVPNVSVSGPPLATAVLSKKQLQYQMSHGIDYSWVYMRADPEGLQEIRRLCDAGKFNIPVEKTYPITQVREAHEAKDKRIIIGKVVLEVD